MCSYAVEGVLSKDHQKYESLFRHKVPESSTYRRIVVLQVCVRQAGSPGDESGYRRRPSARSVISSPVIDLAAIRAGKT